MSDEGMKHMELGCTATWLALATGAWLEAAHALV
jgi:hypothetical protein